METLKNLISCICAGMIFFGIVAQLVPKGAMEKNFKSVIAVFFISIIIFSVSGISKIDLDLDFLNTVAISIPDDLTKAVGIQKTDAVISSVEQILNENFNNKKINVREVEVITDKTQNESIIINEIRVVCEASDAEKCREIVEALGFTPIIEVYRND